MSREEVLRVCERFRDDLDFRRRLREDPQGVLRKEGFGLDPEEWLALERVDWSLSDDELMARAADPDAALRDWRR